MTASAFGYVVMMIVAGAAVAVQAPVNTALGRVAGPYEAAFFSFALGTIVTLALMFTLGRGSVTAVALSPWWTWIGGLLGAGFVTAVILSVPQLGVSTMMVAGLFGQIASGLAIDHFGWFGVTTRPLDVKRTLALVCFAAALWLLWTPKPSGAEAPAGRGETKTEPSS